MPYTALPQPYVNELVKLAAQQMRGEVRFVILHKSTDEALVHGNQIPAFLSIGSANAFIAAYFGQAAYPDPRYDIGFVRLEDLPDDVFYPELAGGVS